MLGQSEDEEWKAKGMKNRKVRQRKMGEGGGEKCKTGEEEEVPENIQKQGGGGGGEEERCRKCGVCRWPVENSRREENRTQKGLQAGGKSQICLCFVNSIFDTIKSHYMQVRLFE